MYEILVKLLPVFLFFGLGIVLKRIQFANNDNADFLLRLVFFVTLPALVLLRLSQTPITLDKLYLPLINIVINLSCMVAMLIMSRFAQVQRKTLGTMLVGSMITNNVFMFPFIMVGFGNSGFVDLKLVSITILIRVGIGLSVGAALAYVLGITGQTFAVVILCSAAPVGFMALTFASIAKLDKAFASKLVSASILLGIIYVPILMFLLGV